MRYLFGAFISDCLKVKAGFYIMSRTLIEMSYLYIILVLKLNKRRYVVPINEMEYLVIR